ncbi:hypothetical protein ACFVY4_21295 [Streptomyces sp. NPDC058299]|uniref:hypothetical protein n=1 Tax=Streptomyces sp. NPDC058299 TaxID=3346435 RepID=UPI0036DFDD8C
MLDVVGIRVAGLHVGFMHTDMTRDITEPRRLRPTSPASPPTASPRGAYEILADDLSRQVRPGLAEGVAGLCPQLP